MTHPLEEVFDFEAVENIDYEIDGYTKAIFKQDFGVFKKDHQYDFLELNFDDFEMKTYDYNGEVVLRQKFAIVPR